MEKLVKIGKHLFHFILVENISLCLLKYKLVYKPHILGNCSEVTYYYSVQNSNQCNRENS